MDKKLKPMSLTCDGCGRETDGYLCFRCNGHAAQINDSKDHHVLTFDGDPVSWQSEPEEDDYSEDSFRSSAIKVPYIDYSKEDAFNLARMKRLCKKRNRA
ncbi:hypothetical protein LCGC14_1342190 [marine sediment metagenome]|uniref:Uncharacterized protein n=1 Tax=marine sediment metagenome TaxID=412755 RepID=A0A0F9MU72_9ZZZZ